MGIGFYKSYVILVIQMSQLAFTWCSGSCTPHLVSQITSRLNKSDSLSFSTFPHEASAPAFDGHPLSSLQFLDVFPVLRWAKLGALFCIFSLFIRGECSLPSYTSNISNTVCCQMSFLGGYSAHLCSIWCSLGYPDTFQ